LLHLLTSAHGTSQPWQLLRKDGRSRLEIGRWRLSRSLSARARSRIAELDQEIEWLQRSEEAIVVATGAPREPGCPAWVVLGVKAVEARGALHGEMHSGGTTSPPTDAQADVAL
jgi:hypothetical protein